MTFDPFMHHGPQIIWTGRLKAYPEPILPMVLYDYGIELMPGAKHLAVSPLARDEESLQSLLAFRKFFSERMAGPPVRNGFELEWLISSVLLLPAIYLQLTTGDYMYKRFTFDAAAPDFPRRFWRPIDIASYVRRTLPDRPRLPRLIRRFSRYFGAPELIMLWAKHSRTSRAIAESVRPFVDCRFMRQCVELIDEMLAKSGAQEHSTT